MKCAHIHEFQSFPETEMLQLCQHAYLCPTCKYGWDCQICGVIINQKEMNPKVIAELDAILKSCET